MARLPGRLALVLALVAALGSALHAPRAEAADFFVGVDEDAVKWGQTELANAVARTLGVKAIRVTVPWRPGETRLSSLNRQYLDRAIVGSWGLRVVVSVYGGATDAPRTEAARAQYCDYVGDLLGSYPTVSDVVIWNDPNDGTFWGPQYNADRSSAAPSDYAALLARCWSSLHAVRPAVNVVSLAASLTGTQTAVAEAHDPLAWYQKLGAAYRASGRTQPLFDTVGYIPHSLNTAERPWVRHRTATTVGQGDYLRLMGALTAAFSGTPQPLPGQANVSIWYLAHGFQTTVDASKARAYTGRETDRKAIPAWSPKAAADRRSGPAPDQATQLADAVRVAFCQQTVGAYFNFLLADESRLAGWQSGVLWADWTVKPSFSSFKRVIADANARRINCATFSRGGAPPRPLSTPPADDLKIAAVSASVTPFSATVSWRTTVAAESQAAYGLPGSGPTLWANDRGSGLTREATLSGLDAGRLYRVWLTTVSEDGQRAQTSIDVRTPGLPRSPRAGIGGGALLLDGQPFFPFVVWSQCPDGYGANLAAGINLFAENPCGGLEKQLDALGGRAYSAAVAGKEGGSAPSLIGYFLPDEPDGLQMSAAQLPPRPSGTSSQVGFLTLTNHFYSGAAPLPWAVDYPSLIAKSDVVGFDLYPLQEWCRPDRLGDVYASQQELVRLSAPRPTFQWIEAAEWRCPGGATAITPAVVIAESWMAIAGGANGLGFFPAIWPAGIGRAIADVSNDVAKLGAALVAPSAPVTSEGRSVYVGARALNGAIYVIAVNGSYAPTRATIRVPGLGTRSLSVLDEGRRVLSNSDAFSDEFAPLAVHVYVAAPSG